MHIDTTGTSCILTFPARDSHTDTETHMSTRLSQTVPYGLIRGQSITTCALKGPTDRFDTDSRLDPYRDCTHAHTHYYGGILFGCMQVCVHSCKTGAHPFLVAGRDSLGTLCSLALDCAVKTTPLFQKCTILETVSHLLTFRIIFKNQMTLKTVLQPVAVL